MIGFVYFLLPLVIIPLSNCGEKLPHRTPRQASEDEPVENKVAGTWGLWGAWSACSQTCGFGVIERSRTCLSPYQQVPWMPRSDPNPHIVPPQPQPPFHDDRSNIFSMGPARPAYPFHTDGEIAASYVDPYLPRNPNSRYNPFNRNTRQETVPGGSQPIYPRRDYPPYHRSTSNRGRGVPRNPDTLWQPSPQDIPHRQDALRASETISIHRKPHQDSPLPYNTRNSSRSDEASQPWPFFPDSIPLLKPDSWEEPNPGQAFPPLTPTKESRFSRRSRVRNAIKPGKYGYGKVPFALSLHTEKEESQRSKRDHKMVTFSTTTSPKKDLKKEVRSTQPSMVNQGVNTDQSSSQSTEISGATSKRRSQSVRRLKRSSQYDYTSWTELPEYDFNIGKDSDSSTATPKLRSSIKGTDGSQDSQFAIWDSWVDVDGHRDTSVKDRTEDSLELRNRRTIFENVLVVRKPPEIKKLSPTPPLPANQAMKHVQEDELIRTRILKSAAIAVKRQNSKKLLPTKVVGTVKPIESKLLAHRVDISIKNGQQAESERGHHERFIHEHSNRQATKTIQNNDSTSGEATENEQKSHQPRSRSQRQSPYRHSTDSSRAYHSLYKDNPVQGDPWTQLGRNVPLTYDRGQEQRSSLHHDPELPQWNLYNPGTEAFHCEGEKKQYKSCNQEACPVGQPDARTLQCSTFNNQEFMGRLYQWEAFTEGTDNSRMSLSYNSASVLSLANCHLKSIFKGVKDCVTLYACVLNQHMTSLLTYHRGTYKEFLCAN